MSTEEDALLKQIIALHKPDGRQIDVKSLLQLVKLITLFTDQTQDEPSQDIPKAVQSVTSHISELHKTMQDRSKGEGKHDTSMSLLSVITNFSWDAKAVLVLASLAMNHGVWMLAQMYSVSSPALEDKDHYKLYRLLGFCQPKRLELDAYYFYLSLIYSFSKRPKKNQLQKPALTKLFQSLTGVADCIIQLQELPAADLQGYVTEYDYAMSRMPVAVYDLVNIVVHCAAVISRFPSNDYEISVAEEKELSEYTDQLNRQTKDFTDPIKACNQFIEETKADKAHQIPIPETSRTDNRKALEFLIEGSADQRLQKVADDMISHLKGKYVLLLVSDEESSTEEILLLDIMYREDIQLQKEQLSILWIPVYSGLGTGIDHQFRTQGRNMLWHSVPHPSMISKEAAEFIKETWRLQSKTNILVVLDPQGTVLNINAFYMLWIWGTQAFPFTRSRERATWKTQALNMEFLVDRIDPLLIQLIKEDKNIFLYGGDDIEWAQKFTTTVKSVADDMGIPIELMYVGKSSKGDQTSTSKIEDAIRRENLSLVLDDDKMQCWFFWSRLRSMLISKMSHQRGLESEDWTTRQLKWLLGYETEKSWAVLGKGDAEVTHGPGSTVLQVLTMCDRTRISEADSFIFIDRFRGLNQKVLKSRRVCCQVEFPIPSSWMLDMMRCPDPHCELEMMDERIVFQCCHPSPSRTRVPDLTKPFHMYRSTDSF